MSQHIHDDAGTELIDDDCPAIIDGSGLVRKLGAVIEEGLVSSFPVFEDALPLLSDDEIKEYITSGRKPKSGRHVFGTDWIADQKQFGSCAGWASAKALERARFRKGLERVKLSGSSVYAQVNGGRDNGSVPEHAMKAMQERGVVPEGPSAVNEIYMRHYSETDWKIASRYRAAECYTTRDRQALLTGVALGFDAVVAVMAGSRFMRLNGDGIAGSDAGRGNHAVLIDDVDIVADELVFDMANSWNVTYGENGRAYLTWDRHFRGTVGTFAFYLVRTATDDPQGDNPPDVKE